jgi:hypothetical protein
MADLETTLSLAERGKCSRAETYSALQALAEQHRQPGESTAQAFSKYVGGEGRELFHICQSLPGREVDAAAPIAKSVPSGEWHNLVDICKRAHKRAHPHATESAANAAAVSAAMSTPEGMFLFRQQKRAEQVRSGLFTRLDMQVLDGAAAEQQHHADLHKRSGKSEYEDMVDKVRQAKPHLTESQAGNHVRSTQDGMEAWLKHKGKPGMNGLTMTEDPPRISQWHSPHAGSRYTPPAGTPRSASDIRPGPDDAPALKAWDSMKKKLMFDTGSTEERAVEILKLLPAGRFAIARVIEEAEAAVARS